MAAKLAFPGAKPFTKGKAVPKKKAPVQGRVVGSSTSTGKLVAPKPRKAKAKEPSTATLKNTDKVITTVGALRKLMAAPKRKAAK